MVHLVCDPLHNTPGMHDDDGAFEPGASKIAAALGPQAERLSIDNLKPEPERFADFLQDVTAPPMFESWVFVSHGWHTGIEEGLANGNLPRLAAKVPPKVVLFCCSTASPPLATSFAAALVKYGAQDVVAHDRRGHAFLNPYAVHVRQVGVTPESRFIVEPGSANWHAWIAFLRSGGWIDLALFAIDAGAAQRGNFSRGADGFFVWTP
jgi:hypothetical protein